MKHVHVCISTNTYIDFVYLCIHVFYGTEFGQQLNFGSEGQPYYGKS